MPSLHQAYRANAPIVAELAAGAVVIRDDRLLLLHEPREDRWCLPKGHVDPGESLEAAAAREVREETGLDDVRLGVEVAEVSYRFYAPARGLNVHKTSVYFLGTSPAGVPALESTFDRFVWVTLEAALPMVPYVTDRTVLEGARRVLAGRR